MTNTTRTRAASDWLKANMPDKGYAFAGSMLRRAHEAGHSPSSITRARWALRIESGKALGRHGPWLWEFA